MFSAFFRGILGLLGIIKKTLKFDTDHNDEFKRSIKTCAIVLTHKDCPMGNAIDAASNSVWCHSLLYVGKTWGTMIRSLVPVLALNPKIPKEALENEIVEAQGEGIKVGQLPLDPDVQMVAYQRELSFLETVRVLTRIYINVGKPYGYLDFIADAFPDLPIPEIDPGFICSALTTDAYTGIETIGKKGVNLKRITPGQQNDYLEPNLKWQKITWNW